jgi:thioredoxin-like negative regulator of GroEL
MVTFGANWCMDCRTLYRNLNNEEVADYARDLFLFVNVNVGKFNRNRQLADELGVDLSRGIPVAIFFDPDGRVIGTTNEGQLEPARRYSSKQILRFLRDIAERERVLAPDSVGMQGPLTGEKSFARKRPPTWGRFRFS